MKQALCLLVCLTVVLGTMLVPVSATTANGVLWDATTSETAMLGAVTNGTSPNWDTTNANWYGNRLPVLRDDSAWGDHMIIGDTLGTVITEKTVKLSFEFAPKASYMGGPDFYVSVFNQNTSYADGAEGQFKGFAEFDPNGTDANGENTYDAVKMSYYGTMDGINTSPSDNEWANPIAFNSPNMAVTQNQWYCVESIYDLKNELVTHYVNGQLLGTAKGPNAIGGISVFRRQNNKLGYGELDLYNLQLTEVASTLSWDATTSETAMLGAVTNGTSPNWDTTNADWYGGRLPVLRDDAAWGNHMVIGDKFDKVITGKKVKVSFEFAPKATYMGGPDFYVSVFNQNTSYEDGAEGQFKGFAEFDPNGTDTNGENGYDAVKMSYYGTETTANTSPCENEWTNPIVFTNPTLPVTQGAWYLVESLYDLENETVTHIVNGEVLGTAKGPNAIGGISIYRRQNNKLGYGELDIYNFKIAELADKGEILFCDIANQVLTREDLKTATEVQAKQVNISANGNAGSCYYICAIYSEADDSLQDVTLKVMSYSANGLSFDSQVIGVGDGEYAKVFLWDSLTELKPMCQEYMIGK